MAIHIYYRGERMKNQTFDKKQFFEKKGVVVNIRRNNSDLPFLNVRSTSANNF